MCSALSSFFPFFFLLSSIIAIRALVISFQGEVVSVRLTGWRYIYRTGLSQICGITRWRIAMTGSLSHGVLGDDLQLLVYQNSNQSDSYCGKWKDMDFICSSTRIEASTIGRTQRFGRNKRKKKIQNISLYVVMSVDWNASATWACSLTASPFHPTTCRPTSICTTVFVARACCQETFAVQFC